jgi:uncharacterized protein GlcG (DUF336 family)
MTLKLSEAKRIAEGAVKKAEELNIRISVAVTDTGGRLIAFNKMDGGIWAASYGCQGKAAAASAFGMPTSEIVEKVDPIEIKEVDIANGGHFALGHGGVPIYREGILIGACGVGGGSGGEDEACASAGVASTI